MKIFPSILNVKNNKNFEKIHYTRTLCYLRRDIYNHIISHEENNYFDLGKFNENNHKDMKISLEMIRTIIKELTDLGWKCKLSFGETALFIYSSDKTPASCWDDGL
jgi:hypothetical protein